MSRKRTLATIAPKILLVALGLFWLIPLVWTVLAAFVPTSQLLSFTPLVWMQNLTFTAFREAWSVAPFARYYINTIIWVFGLLFLQLIAVSLAGYALARIQVIGMGFVFFLFLTQLMVPASVLLLPNYQTIVRLGWMDSYQAMMAPYFASAFGTFLMRQAFKQVPKELEEAARMDGANALHILWYVFIPVTRASLVAFSIVSISYHWNEFLWPLLVTSTVRSRPLTVGLALLTQMSETGAQWDQLAAGTLIVAIPVLVLIIVLQKQFTQSFLSSGIK
jgi:sn-glycerol 3-phosphate transport system permease protein